MQHVTQRLPVIALPRPAARELLGTAAWGGHAEWEKATATLTANVLVVLRAVIIIQQHIARVVRQVAVMLKWTAVDDMETRVKHEYGGRMWT